MKHHKKTDRIIKNKMENYSMDTPMHLFEGITSALETEISPAIEPMKKSGRSGYWLMALLLLTLVGGGIWYATTDTSNAQAEKISTNAVDGETALTVKKEGEEILNKNEKTNQDLVSEKLNTTSNFSILENKNTGSNQSVTSSTNASFEDGNSSQNISDVENGSLKPNSKNSKTSNFKNTIPEDNLTQKGIDQTIFSKSDDTDKIISSSQISETPLIEASQITESNSTGNKAAQKTLLNKNNSAARAKEDVLFLPKLRTTKQLLSTRPTETTQVNIETACGLKPDGSKIRFTTSVDAIFSLDYASQILEYKSIDFKDYAQSRMDSESPYYSFSGGFRVNFLTEYNWAFRIGLVYSQINEIFKIEKNTVITTYDANGNIESSIPGKKIVNVLNHYRLFDVPLLIGYETELKRFKLNINGGAFVNLKSMQSGAINSPFEENAHLYFTKDHPDDYEIFKNRIGFSTFLSLGFNIPLDRKTQIIIEPNIRYYPKSFTISEYILNQKYLTTGLMVGLRRDL